MECELLE